jgi:hypothetical protein
VSLPAGWSGRGAGADVVVGSVAVVVLAASWYSRVAFEGLHEGRSTMVDSGQSLQSFGIENPFDVYGRLPALRRGSTASGLLVVALVLILGAGFFGPVGGSLAALVGSVLVLAVSITLFTGKIFYPPKTGEPALRPWSKANHVVAVLMVVGGILEAVWMLIALAAV